MHAALASAMGTLLTYFLSPNPPQVPTIYVLEPLGPSIAGTWGVREEFYEASPYLLRPKLQSLKNRPQLSHTLDVWTRPCLPRHPTTARA